MVEIQQGPSLIDLVLLVTRIIYCYYGSKPKLMIQSVWLWTVINCEMLWFLSRSTCSQAVHFLLVSCCLPPLLGIWVTSSAAWMLHVQNFKKGRVGAVFTTLSSPTRLYCQQNRIDRAPLLKFIQFDRRLISEVSRKKLNQGGANVGYRVGGW